MFALSAEPAGYSGSSRPRILTAFALLVLIFGFALIPKLVQAQKRSGIALSVEASTIGPSVGVHVRAIEGFRIRVRGSYLPYSFDRDLNDTDAYDQIEGDIWLGGPEVRLDWQPLRSSFSSFFISIGALYNVMEVDALMFPTSPYEFSNSKTFSAEEIGETDVEVSYAPVSPYAGIGFGDVLSGRWSFTVALGAYYTGPPDFTFEGSGLTKVTEQNETILEEGFNSFRFFPNLAVGLSYQF